jgi:iron complex transport system permease protein
VYLVARTRRGGPLRLILVGVGVAAVAYALTTAIITVGRIFAVGTAVVWMAGSVYGRTWEHLGPLVPWVAILLPATWMAARHLDVLGMGDDVAQALGARVELARGVLLFMSVGLAGAAVATAGAVGFVGLMAPHIARLLVGPSHAGVLPTTALTGGLLVVAADLVGRTFFGPAEVPCGIITAALGAPFFLYLLHRGQQATA